jgi:hypothetical protein
MNLGFINNEFFSHIIFMSTFSCFSRAGIALDEIHIRAYEYGIFTGFEKWSCKHVENKAKVKQSLWS